MSETIDKAKEAPDPSADRMMPYLPPEIWKAIIEFFSLELRPELEFISSVVPFKADCAGVKDLKQLRLVDKTLAVMAAPFLFRSLTVRFQVRLSGSRGEDMNKAFNSLGSVCKHATELRLVNPVEEHLSSDTQPETDNSATYHSVRGFWQNLAPVLLGLAPSMARLDTLELKLCEADNDLSAPQPTWNLEATDAARVWDFFVKDFIGKMPSRLSKLRCRARHLNYLLNSGNGHPRLHRELGSVTELYLWGHSKWDWAWLSTPGPFRRLPKVEQLTLEGYHGNDFSPSFKFSAFRSFKSLTLWKADVDKDQLRRALLSLPKTVEDIRIDASFDEQAGWFEKDRRPCPLSEARTPRLKRLEIQLSDHNLRELWVDACFLWESSRDSYARLEKWWSRGNGAEWGCSNEMYKMGYVDFDEEEED